MATIPNPRAAEDHIARTGAQVVRVGAGCPDEEVIYPIAVDIPGRAHRLARVCGFEPLVQGSQVAVGPGGEVYVAWEAFAGFLTREIDIRKSTDNGLTFDPAVKVADVAPVGDGFLLQGAFRAAFEFPSLAVDGSGTATNGHVYLTLHNGSLTVGDELFGTYSYADVLVSRSTDGAATWSAPVTVNDNPEPLPRGFGTDQYQPGLAVNNKNGELGVCFYDRRRDPLNFLIDRECATSTNAGANWTNARQTMKNFAAVPAQDFKVVARVRSSIPIMTAVFHGMVSQYQDAFLRQ